MSKFKTNLVETNDSIKEKRANLLEAKISAEQEILSRDLEAKINNINYSIMEMEDFGPSSSFDLTMPDVSARNWVIEYQRLKISKRNLVIALALALETSDEWFSESK